jgi:capsule polysaccharide export protein KpsE/RkpR
VSRPSTVLRALSKAIRREVDYREKLIGEEADEAERSRLSIAGDVLTALASAYNEAAEDLDEQWRVANASLDPKEGEVRFDPKGKPFAV